MSTRVGSAALTSTGIPEFLHYDPRPTLVYELLGEELATSEPLQPVHRNPAFQEFWNNILVTKNPAEADLYLASLNKDFDRPPQHKHYQGHNWSSFISQGRWKIISCDAVSPVSSSVPTRTSERVLEASTTEGGLTADNPRSPLPAPVPHLASQRTSNPVQNVPGTQQEPKKYISLDWTQHDVDGMSEYIQFLRRFDWASTPLGPLSQWSSYLRQNAVSVMTNPDPRILIWGSEHVLIYNEASVPLIGSKHPHALGRPASFAFAEVSDQMAPYIDAAMEEGRVTQIKKFALPMDRFGFLEETFWNFTMIPVVDANGIGLGAIDEFLESTSLVLAERRMATVVKIGEVSTNAETLEDVWIQSVKALDENSLDIPLALLYVIDDDNGEEEAMSSALSVSSSNHSAAVISGKHCSLKGLVGIDKDNPGAFDTFDLSESSQGYSIPFAEALRTGKPVFLNSNDGSLPPSLSQGTPGRVSGVGCTRAVVCAVRSLSSRRVVGFLIVGLNPQRPYDDDYQLFIRLILDQLASSIAIISLPLEQRKAQIAAEEAATMHATLARQLMLRTQEAEKSEAKFTRMAQHAPVGMFLCKPDATPIYLNEAYYELTGIQRDAKISFESNSWRQVIYPDDLSILENAWQIINRDKRPLTYEFRLNRPWKSVEKVTNTDMTGSTWLHATAFPELDDDGSVRAIFGWITDISLNKYTADLQSRRLTEALEKKRQNENFIDMTSHEMRNPLSAIIQSADGILMLYKNVKPNNRGASTIPFETIENTVDAAETIVLCAQHQKRIVDDVLTLSKLESNLMMVAPDKVRPLLLVKQVLKMYEAELQNAEIETSIDVGQSYKEKGIDKVFVDPSRLLQILINLLTNAIKFTRNRDRRVIKVSLSASYEKPVAESNDTTYIPQREGRTIPKISIDRGSGKDVYLQFAVHDTGKGLSKDEMQLLFNRFSQASQKTYSEYGGSGLGLFISKELSELLGGQIGVRSNKGEGCTFTFFVKAYQLDPGAEDTPTEEMPQDFESPLHPPGLGHKTRPEAKRSVSEFPFTKRPATSRRSSSKGLLLSPLSPPSTATPLVKDGLHILVVEDNAINQRVTAQQLRIAGCTVHVADNGMQALDFLKGSAFSSQPTADASPSSRSSKAPARQGIPLSVVLLDLEMPVMDGLTCIRQIREMEAAGKLIRRVPVIAVTANARSEQIATALAAGMDLVITKPFRIPDLLPQMEALVKG